MSALNPLGRADASDGDDRRAAAGLRRDVAASIAALTTVLLWAIAFPLTTIALRSLEPANLAAFRIGIAGCLMGLWLAWRRPVLPRVTDLGMLALSGVIGIALFSLSLHAGQVTVSASATSFIVNTAPVMTALLAAAFLGERLRALAWVCSLVSLLGIAIIASDQPGGLSLGAGSTYIFIAALCQATYFILQRRLLMRYGPSTCVAVVVVSAALSLSPWLPGALIQVSSASTDSLLAAIALGIFPAAVGNATWSIAQSHFGPSRTANFLYLIPAAATALAYLLTDEEPTWMTLAGGAVTVGGVVLFNLVQRRPA